MLFNIPYIHSNASGIYAIVNEVNHKVYVGSAIKLNKRYWDHLHKLRKGSHHCLKLSKAISKYGIEKFSFILLEACEKNILIMREQAWIDKLNAVKEGYNICPIAGSAIGRKMTEETRLKIAKANTGKKKSPEEVEKMRERARGVKKTKETIEKQKVSRRLGGYVVNEKTRLKISLIHKGKKATEEQKKKLSLSHIGKQMGENSGLAKKVTQYNLDGTFVKQWSCIAEAARELNYMEGRLYKCASGNRRYAYKFIWCYGDNIPEPFKKTRKKNARKIIQMDLNGNVLSTWPSITDAAEQNNYSTGNISMACTGRRKKAYGFIWKYAA